MLNKLLFLFFFLSFNGFGHIHTIDWQQGSIDLSVNESAVRCSGLPADLYWTCNGDKIKGFIQRLPEQEDFIFLPFFTDVSGQKLELEIAISIAPTHEIRFAVFDKDYFSLNLNGLVDDIEEKTKLARRFAPLITSLGEFLSLFTNYLNSLKDLAIEQKISCVDGIISSRLLAHPEGRKKDENAPISSILPRDLTEEERRYYDSLQESVGQVISLDEAENLFELIKNRSDIPFSYTSDGCFARAHTIAHWLFNENIRTGKIWLSGKLTNPYEANKLWVYHVAALIYVQIGEDIIPKVIDPSPTVNRLLSIEEWLDENGVASAKLLPYPLPPYCNLYGETLMSISSHRPLLPFKANVYRSEQEELEEAREKNRYYLRLSGISRRK